MHAAGWLEGGLTVGYEKFVMDADQLGMMQVFAKGIDLSDNGQALDAIRENEPGQHFLGTAHTLANFEQAFYRSSVARQLQLRAVGGGRQHNRSAAGQYPLEGAIGLVRAATNR